MKPIFKNHGRSVTTGTFALYWRTRHISKGTKHAAVSRLGFEEGVTGFAIVEPLTGVGRHGLGLAMAAARTGQRGSQDRRFHARYRTRHSERPLDRELDLLSAARCHQKCWGAEFES